jgi:hypothetical protein
VMLGTGREVSLPATPPATPDGFPHRRAVPRII